MSRSKKEARPSVGEVIDVPARVQQIVLRNDTGKEQWGFRIRRTIRRTIFEGVRICEVDRLAITYHPRSLEVRFSEPMLTGETYLVDISYRGEKIVWGNGAKRRGLKKVLHWIPDREVRGEDREAVEALEFGKAAKLFFKRQKKIRQVFSSEQRQRRALYFLALDWETHLDSPRTRRQIRDSPWCFSTILDRAATYLWGRLKARWRGTLEEWNGEFRREMEEVERVQSDLIREHFDPTDSRFVESFGAAFEDFASGALEIADERSTFNGQPDSAMFFLFADRIPSDRSRLVARDLEENRRGPRRDPTHLLLGLPRLREKPRRWTGLSRELRRSGSTAKLRRRARRGKDPAR